MSVKVSPKYQVVIPEDARKQLSLRPGMEVEIIVKGNIAYIVPVPDLKSIQNRFSGDLDSKNLREKD